MKEMPFGTGAARPKDDPTESLARKVALLLELLRHQTLDVERACQRYDADKRTLQRDLSQLRKLGESLGFSISKTENGLVKLMDFERRPRQFADDRGALAQLAAEIARAFGAPMGEQLGSLATLRPGGDPFIRFLSPILAADSRVAKIVAQLQDAMKSPAGRCFVRFRYKTTKATEERLVEPDHIVIRSGRYYLVGYDRGRKDWRFFALDSMVGEPARAGTIPSVRTVPVNYRSDDVLGFFKDAGPPVTVTIAISAAVSASITSRVWQSAQTVEHRADGSALLTIAVHDVGEAVRWAFGFAPEARIVAPPEAIATAKALAEKLLALHARSS
jgi:predicted DNA-binding transcriptional regulator YafY